MEDMYSLSFDDQRLQKKMGQPCAETSQAFLTVSVDMAVLHLSGAL